MRGMYSEDNPGEIGARQLPTGCIGVPIASLSLSLSLSRSLSLFFLPSLSLSLSLSLSCLFTNPSFTRSLCQCCHVACLLIAARFGMLSTTGRESWHGSGILGCVHNEELCSLCQPATCLRVEHASTLSPIPLSLWLGCAHERMNEPTQAGKTTVVREQDARTWSYKEQIKQTKLLRRS